MKVLVLRFSSIGDIVLTTPVVRCLRKAHPDAEIHYATKKAYVSLLQANPYINKIHALGNSFSQLVQQLKAEKFDYVIDLHNNQRTLLLKWQLGVKSNSFSKLNFEKWLMVQFKINRLPALHIVDRYMAAAKPLHVVNDGLGLDYFIPKAEEVSINLLPEVFASAYVAWVIGAKQNTKKFPVSKIISTIKLLGTKPVVLLGGPEDRVEAATIQAELSNANIRLFNAVGAYSLNQSASLIRQAAVVITNDTGLMHIAAAFNKPIVSIWGNTIPQFGMYPYTLTPGVVMEVKGLSCRPCSKLGYSSCPKGHFKCMNEQSEDVLVQHINRLFP